MNHLRIAELGIDASGNIRQHCGMGNVLVSIPLATRISPYIGAGAGYRHINSGVNFDESSDQSIDNFIDSSNKWGVYQVMAGFNVMARDYLSVQIEYRYLDAFANNECANHSVCAAVSVGF